MPLTEVVMLVVTGAMQGLTFSSMSRLLAGSTVVGTMSPDNSQHASQHDASSAAVRLFDQHGSARFSGN